MYKMLIAEQDEEQISILKKHTETEFKEVKIVGIEKSGGAALKFLKENPVDILVIAVNIKGISGLEVIRNVRKHNHRLHIIIVTSYDYSYFVLTAMNYGIKAYLLKPINLMEYSNVMQEVIDDLEHRRAIKEHKRELKQREHRIDIFNDHSFIYSFLWNNRNTHLLKLYKEILGLDKFGFILNLEYIRKGEECVLDIDKDIQIIHQGIKDAVSEMYPCVVGPRIGNRIIIYVSQKEEKNKKEVAVSVANMLHTMILTCFDVEMRIGIGGTKRIEDVHKSYEEAIKCLRYLEQGDTVHIEDAVSNVVSHKDYMDLEAKFLQSVRFGKEECLEHFAIILDILQPLKLYDAKNKLLELVVMVCREVHTLCGECEINNFDYMGFVHEISELKWEDLKTWAYAKIEYTMKIIRASRTGTKSVAVKEALEYVNEHYKENLTLKVIANIVGVTPQHFSKIFKEETKSKYVDWLTEVRIERAKEYILDGSRNINQICFAVGFRDPNYFSRRFKETVGVSPTEYGKMNLLTMTSKYES